MVQGANEEARFFLWLLLKKEKMCWGGWGGGCADIEDRGWKPRESKHPERDKSRLREILVWGSRAQHLRTHT